MSEPKRSNSDAPSALPRIEGYRIEGVLGRGSTGVVYSAVQVAVDRPVALKLLHRELMGNRKAARRLQREARTAAKLAHPAIISAIDMGESEGRWWYAMELVEGISLGERIDEQGVLSEREALRFFAPVVDALQYASEAGVTHRDVKPANILVDPHGKARVVDLGLAIAEDDPALTSPGGTLGTPHYISPEQAKDPSSADTRSDIYSLGATMYHALCGRPPFQGSSVAEVLSAVLYHRVPDPRQFRPELSKGISLVLRKCLARDPEKRYAEPQELAADLERLRERRAPEVSVASLDPLPGERRGGKRLAIFAAFLLLGGAGAWGLWQRSLAERATPGASESEPFADLDALAAQFKGQSLDHRQVLAELGRWLSPRGDAELSAVQRTLARDFQGDVLAHLDSELGRVRSLVQASYEAEVEKGDLVAARDSIASTLSGELFGATGYRSLADLPRAVRSEELTRWHRGLQDAADHALEQAYGQRVGRVLRYVNLELEPRVSQDIAAKRYVDAEAQLAPSARGLLDLSGASSAGLEEEVLLERIEVRVRPIFEGLGRDNRLGWQRRDVALEQAVKARASELGHELTLDPGRDPAAELDEHLQLLLRSGGPDLEQVPEGWERRHQAALFVARGELKARRQELREQAARADLERDATAAADFLAQRRYGAAVELWDERLAATWRASVHPEMRVSLHEARLLEGFLKRVREGIRRSNGKSVKLYHRSIPQAGTLDVAGDPAVKPFRLRVALRGGESSELEFTLLGGTEGEGAELLVAPDVEMFADPAASPLELALFRFHEGDLDGAGELLEGRVAAGSQELDDALWRRLGERLRQSRTEADDARERRMAELEGKLLSLSLDSTDAGTSGATIRKKVDELRQTYRELLTGEHNRRLESALRQAAARAPRPTLKVAFPTANLELGTPYGSYRPVTLTWEFAEEDPGAWLFGPFVAEGGGLVQAKGPGSLATWLAPTGAAVLPLGEPLVPDNSLRVEVRFRLPAGSRPNNEIMLSLAGYTLVFLDYTEDPRFFGGPGKRVDVLEQAYDSSRSSFRGFAGLDRSKVHTLVVDIDPRANRLVDVQLGASPLTFPSTFPSLGGRQGGRTPTLELRSLQSIEILSVVVATNSHL